MKAEQGLVKPTWQGLDAPIVFKMMSLVR